MFAIIYHSRNFPSVEAVIVILLQRSLHTASVGCASYRFMAPKNITLLGQLDLSHEKFTLKVRVIRLTKQLTYDKKKTFRIDIILVDEEGTKIEAQVPSRWVFRFEKMLAENESYYIENPQVGENTADNKFVNNSNKLHFCPITMVTKSNDFVGPLYGFSFENYQTIIGNNILEKTPVDVIGHVLLYFPKETFMSKHGKETRRQNVQIQDLEGRKVSVTLWDEYAQQFVDYVSNNPEERTVIIIIQFGKVSDYRGCLSVSNWYFVTKLYINANIEEILLFKNTKDSSSLLYYETDEFLLKHDFKPITEIQEITKVSRVIVLGTVDEDIMMNIELNDGSNGKKMFVCSSSICNNKVVVSVLPRFKIPIRVQDPTGVISLTLFDGDANRLLRKNAQELLEIFNEDGNTAIFPVEITDLLERKFAFLIEVSEYNLKNKVQGYSIRKLTADRKIHSELEKKFTVDEHVDSDSFNTATFEVTSQETTNFKDAISFTGDNITPASNVEKSTATSPLAKYRFSKVVSPNAELKRNLS
ncbi:unnamed protein product [Lactuca saligna]|uniref:Replication protein A OB domain-containing protein n=1 Tax=Lactuca saligna TaxID=75948 RepID=A0AA35ZKY9_LACSI|nr:unnamed protein product [Lactuca saligna]